MPNLKPLNPSSRIPEQWSPCNSLSTLPEHLQNTPFPYNSFTKKNDKQKEEKEIQIEIESLTPTSITNNKRILNHQELTKVNTDNNNNNNISTKPPKIIMSSSYEKAQKTKKLFELLHSLTNDERDKFINIMSLCKDVDFEFQITKDNEKEEEEEKKELGDNVKRKNDIIRKGNSPPRKRTKF